LRLDEAERTLSFDEEPRILKAATPVLRDVGIIMSRWGRGPRIFQLRHEDVRNRAAAPYVHVRKGSPIGLFADVPITSRALPVLNRRVSRAKATISFHGGLEMGTDWSRPMTELDQRIRKRWRKSGIEPPFRLYDLRHAYGTRAIEAGIDVFSV